MTIFALPCSSEEITALQTLLVVAIPDPMPTIPILVLEVDAIVPFVLEEEAFHLQYPQHSSFCGMMQMVHQGRIRQTRHLPWVLERCQQDRLWQMRWPDYCRVCQGYGSWSEVYDPSPAGVSGSGTMTQSGPCSACIENGCCPRCLLDGYEEESPCQACGRTGEDEGRPLREDDLRLLECF